MSAGKGDKPRPIDKKTYDTNYDKIVWKNEKNDATHVRKKGKIVIVYK
jgi:hypothetical protein